MKTLILAVAVLVAFPAFAESDLQKELNSLTDSICRPDPITHKRHKHKKKVALKSGKKVEIVCPVQETKTVTIIQGTPEGYHLVQDGLSTPVVTPVIAESAPAPVQDPSLVLGLHLAVGVAARVPYSSGLVGVLVHYLPFHLGLEGYWAPNNNFGLQALVYTVQGKLSHHIDLGVAGLETGRKLSVVDLNRNWDITAGTGVEYQLFKHLSLTADLRMTVPDPWYLAKHNSQIVDANGDQVTGEAGKYLNLKHVLWNSLTETQLLVGALVRI